METENASFGTQSCGRQAKSAAASSGSSLRRLGSKERPRSESGRLTRGATGFALGRHTHKQARCRIVRAKGTTQLGRLPEHAGERRLKLVRAKSLAIPRDWRKKRFRQFGSKRAVRRSACDRKLVVSARRLLRKLQKAPRPKSVPTT